MSKEEYTKEEYINELRVELMHRISYAEVENNVANYRTYINEEIAKGRREQEVLQTLGSPATVAQTISQMGSGGNQHEQMAWDKEQSQNLNYGTGEAKNLGHHFSLPFALPFALDTWWKILLLVLAIALVAWIAFKLIKVIVGFVISHWIIVLVVVIAAALLIRHINEGL